MQCIGWWPPIHCCQWIETQNAGKLSLTVNGKVVPCQESEKERSSELSSQVDRQNSEVTNLTPSHPMG